MAGQAQAVRIHGAGDVEVLKIEDFDAPTPGAGEVLVEVKAAGLNRADCLQRRGFYPAPEGTVPDIPGLEYAGTVVGLGDGATRFNLGDPVRERRRRPLQPLAHPHPPRHAPRSRPPQVKKLIKSLTVS